MHRARRRWRASGHLTLVHRGRALARDGGPADPRGSGRHVAYPVQELTYRADVPLVVEAGDTAVCPNIGVSLYTRVDNAQAQCAEYTTDRPTFSGPECAKCGTERPTSRAGDGRSSWVACTTLVEQIGSKCVVSCVCGAHRFTYDLNPSGCGAWRVAEPLYDRYHCDSALLVDIIAVVHPGQERALDSLPPPYRSHSCVRNTDRVHTSCKRAALALADALAGLAQVAASLAAGLGFADCCCSLLLCCVLLDAAHSLHLSCALRFIASASQPLPLRRAASTFAMAAACAGRGRLWPPKARLLPAPLRAPPWPPFF